ncbi:MAG: hypothetical protein ACRCW9_09730 [Cetobacterium sp.]
MKKVEQIKTKKLSITAKELENLKEIIKVLYEIKDTKFAAGLISFYQELENTVLAKQKEAQEKNEQFQLEHKEELEAFESKRIEILERNALKNSAGEFLFKKGNDGKDYYDFDKEGMEAYNADFKILLEEHSEILKSLSEVEIACANFEIETEIEVNTLEFYLDTIPNLSAKEINHLSAFFEYLK